MRKIISYFPFILALLFLSGCMPASMVVPDRFSTVRDAYPQNARQIINADLPTGSTKTANYAAPYEDVFRAVIESTGQALLNIASSDKNSGLILATKSAKVRNAFDSQINQAYEAERKHFFAIVVSEKGPESTDVQIVSKVQTSCQFNSWFGEEICQEEAKVKYTSDFWHSTSTDMNNLLTFIRNNLFAAGIL